MAIRLANHLGRENHHRVWDRDLPPALKIVPGEEVTLSLRDPSDEQINRTSVASDLLTIDPDRMDPLTGPIWVEGAQPGNTLSIEILDIEIGSWGWSAILPELGLLQDRYPGPYLKIWDLTSGGIDIGRGITFPFRPMIGVIGVAPELSGEFSSTVPTLAGGNIDVKYTQVGSRVLLPVFTEGALLSLGDAHAIQGDGELNGTAIECEADVRIRISLERGVTIAAPRVDTPEPRAEQSERYRSFLGIGPSLWEATRDAAQQAVDAVAASLGVDPEEAYVLLGIIAELRIHEIVDDPNWVVGCMIPLRVFA